MELSERVPSNIRFKKIRYAGDPKKLEVYYEHLIHSSDDQEKYESRSIESPFEPHADFVNSLTALDQHLISLCEQPEDSICEVRSVSFSWKNEIMGAVISGQRTLKHANPTLTLNSPHKTAESYSDEEDPNQILGDDIVIDLEHLCLEAWRFIQGKRANDMFTEQEEGSDEEDRQRMGLFVTGG